MAVVEIVKIESWPSITLAVPEGYHTLLWFVMVMAALVLLFLTLISGAIVIYGTWYLARNKCYMPWNEVKYKITSLFKKNEDQSDSQGIISTDILNEANREIERYDSIYIDN